MILEELKAKQEELINDAQVGVPMTGEDFHFLKDVILGQCAEWDLKTLESKINMYKSLKLDNNIMTITGFYNITTFLDTLTHINDGSLRVGKWFVDHGDHIRSLATQFGPIYEDYQNIENAIANLESNDTNETGEEAENGID